MITLFLRVELLNQIYSNSFCNFVHMLLVAYVHNDTSMHVLILVCEKSIYEYL